MKQEDYITPIAIAITLAVLFFISVVFTIAMLLK
jgi:hypothetical protein